MLKTRAFLGIAGIIATATATISAPASATTYSLGTLTYGMPRIQVGTLTSGNPSDIITFSLTGSSSDVSESLRSFDLSIGGVSFSFSSLMATLFSGAPGSGVAVGTTTGDETYAGLAAGDYYISVEGTPTGTGGGIYTLALLAGQSAAPVPGPAGFLVVGLGMAALMRERKRRQAAALTAATA